MCHISYTSKWLILIYYISKWFMLIFAGPVFFITHMFFIYLLGVISSFLFFFWHSIALGNQTNSCQERKGQNQVAAFIYMFQSKCHCAIPHLMDQRERRYTRSLSRWCKRKHLNVFKEMRDLLTK